MILHRYDLKNGEYKGTQEAQKRPNGEYIIDVVGAVTQEPPAVGEKQAARWTGKDWELVEDHRQTRDKGGVIEEGSGTPYWLPGDTWQMPPRYMTEPGPLPEGAMLSAPEKDVDTMRSEKLSEINGKYDAATSALVSTYPQTELLTFDKQEAEARAWTADHNAETPLVDMLAAGRQMDKAELVRRIIAKADAFALAAGYLTGQRQHYEDLLAAAQTAEEVAAIVPEYILPQGISL